jgi:hypothetical protein
MLTVTVLDSQGPTTYHSSIFAASYDIEDRLGADLPQSLPPREIRSRLFAGSELWILTRSGREIHVFGQEVTR